MARKPSRPRKIADAIAFVNAMQVLDSRGNPTVAVDILTKGGAAGRAIVPSGASTGVHEALELRDGDPKIYGGKGVLKAVANVSKIAKRIAGTSSSEQKKIDELMIHLDGTKNKKNLGANAILGVSMAVARAAAASKNMPLYEYLSKKKKYKLPVPMMNVINGGMHAGNKLSVQEFLIEPVGGKNFSDALRIGAEVYHTLKDTLRQKYGKTSTNVGDEGGYAPPLGRTREALDSMLQAISNAGYTSSQVKVGFDAASSSFFEAADSTYSIDGRRLSAGELSDYYTDLLNSYPIFTIEDPFSEDAFSDFAAFTKKEGNRITIIGDDLYVTNKERIERGIKEKATNAVLIKLNQIGSVTETFEAVSLSRSSGLEIVVSHRSGETEDTFIAHLATAVESPFIKTGAPARGERTAKYNELLRIERELGKNALFAGKCL
jgi:enolase 1/2/3